MNPKLIAGFVVILVLVTITYIYRTSHSYYPHIMGIWHASKEFCSEAEIDEMILYIGEKVSSNMSGQTHGGYIIIRAGGIPVENKYVEMTIVPEFGFGGNKHNFTATIDELDTMPGELQLQLDICDNTILLSDEDQVYGHFIKNNDASLLAKANRENKLEITDFEDAD